MLSYKKETIKIPRLYENKPIKLIRLYITKRGCESVYFNFCDTTQQQVYDFVKMVIEKQQLSVFNKGFKTSCNIREWDKAFIGKNLSLSFVGLTPQKLKELILKEY